MSTIEKIAMGLVMTGLVTTLILPGRNTPAVIGAFGSVFNGALKTAQGR